MWNKYPDLVLFIPFITLTIIFVGYAKFSIMIEKAGWGFQKRMFVRIPLIMTLFFVVLLLPFIIEYWTIPMPVYPDDFSTAVAPFIVLSFLLPALLIMTAIYLVARLVISKKIKRNNDAYKGLS